MTMSGSISPRHTFWIWAENVLFTFAGVGDCAGWSEYNNVVHARREQLNYFQGENFFYAEMHIVLESLRALRHRAGRAPGRGPSQTMGSLP